MLTSMCRVVGGCVITPWLSSTVSEGESIPGRAARKKEREKPCSRALGGRLMVCCIKVAARPLVTCSTAHRLKYGEADGLRRLPQGLLLDRIRLLPPLTYKHPTSAEVSIDRFGHSTRSYHGNTGVRGAAW